MEVFDLSKVESVATERISSTWDELDWAYGSYGGGEQDTFPSKYWGFPKSSISLWSGSPGIGKTRLLVEIMKRFDQLENPLSCMIFQGEISPSRFKGEKMPGYAPRGNIWVSSDIAIDEQIKAIEQYKPALVITDSVQQIEEYKNGRGAKDIVRKIRKVIELTGTHVIFISQLTRSGVSKGGTDLPHEVDVECHIENFSENIDTDLFTLTVEKNRFGKSGNSVVFAHKSWGIECQSEHRFADDDYLKSYGMYVEDLVPGSGIISKKRSWLSDLFRQKSSKVKVAKPVKKEKKVKKEKYQGIKYHNPIWSMQPGVKYNPEVDQETGLRK